MKRLKPQRSPLHHTLNRQLRTLWIQLVHLVAHIRSVMSPVTNIQHHTINLAAIRWILELLDSFVTRFLCLSWWFCFKTAAVYLSFRELFLPLTPLQCPAKPPAHSRHPSVRWRRRAPPPRSPSIGSPGWTWSRRRHLPLGKWQWCAQFRFTHISLHERRQKRRRTFMCWRDQLPRTLQKRGLIKKALLRRWRHRQMFYMFKMKVRFHFNPFNWLWFTNFYLTNWFD